MERSPTHAPIEAGSLLAEHFRCPGELTAFTIAEDRSSGPGFFQFGQEVVLYGECATVQPAASASDPLPDLLSLASLDDGAVELPFDPYRIVENLRHERYVGTGDPERIANRMSRFVHSLYYRARPLAPVPVRKHLQRRYFSSWEKIPFPAWPVDCTVERLFEQMLVLAMQARGLTRLPFIWFWPEGAPSCTAITHDVESAAGLRFCPQFMDLDDSFGIKSSFQVVPEDRYQVTSGQVEAFRARGFEINIHDLKHDGHLLANHEGFLRHAREINRYGREFGARGFRAAVLYRNIDWYQALDFSYDMSVPNVAHLDPQRGGCCTVFPFFNGNLLELPVTMLQDYTLYHILNDYSIETWKRQIDLIRARYGLIQLIAHPDYNIAEKPRRVYSELLAYLAGLRARGETWMALPAEIDVWWRQRRAMRLVPGSRSWRIEGPSSDRARLAWAVLDAGELTYRIEAAAPVN